MSLVRTDSGYEMRFDMGDDGPYPADYRIHGLWVPSDRVPEPEKDELYRMAWNAWHERRAGGVE